ncbi:invasion associated locus B family protein [Paracoccus sp. (in: a-proteobacteria)]|uniref:invasion associated locus B family protein n=1 Tax=Paracoccus sp. TaxID=267 RepID=UPI0028A01FB2|nr:invasion associated locus B family protein [Paracoccus sp. (in: a-proteobacteria)]
MVNRTSTALLAAIFTIASGAGMAFAQATTETAPAAEAPAAAAPAAAPAEAPAPTAEAAAPAAAAPAAPAAGAAAPIPTSAADAQVGQTYVRATHGDWSLRCIKTQDGKDPCELYQLLKDADGGAVAEASVVPVEGKVAAIVTFVAPLETDLQHGLQLQIDANKAMAYPFMVCAQIGCISRVGLTGDELGALKRGKAGSVMLRPFGAPEDQQVKLNLSLTGFTAGFDAVTAAMKELAATTPAAGATAAAPAATPDVKPAQ